VRPRRRPRPRQAPAADESRGTDRPHGAVAALIAELRASQAELESQNEILRYSQAVAERASERFETLFANVPLALMVVDAHDIVVQANAMAHRSFQPSERDRPLAMLQPFVHPNDLARVQQGFAQANKLGHSEITEVVFTIEGHPAITGDLHIARIEAAQEDAPAPVQFLCAVIDQGPLLAERQALQERNAQLHASEKRLAAVIDSALDAILASINSSASPCSTPPRRRCSNATPTMRSAARWSAFCLALRRRWRSRSSRPRPCSAR